LVEGNLNMLRLSSIDNVEVVVGSKNGNITPGSKVACQEISKGSAVIKLGVAIGIATENISEGSIVDHRVMDELEMPMVRRNDQNRQAAISLPSHLTHFNGYLNLDGSAGTRNYLCIATSVQCVSGVAEHAVKKIRDELLPLYKNVDGIVLLNHAYGCGVAIDAPEAKIPRRTLNNLMRNPNFGGYVLLVGLGCEKLRHEMMLSQISENEEAAHYRYDSLYLQSVVETGFAALVSAIVKKAEQALVFLDSRCREKMPISSLVIGMQCGGSDAFSAITANPMLGHMSDALVAAGAATIFSENTECMDAEPFLVERCANDEVASALRKEFEWYRNYLTKGGVDRAANTTPGNRIGGLSTISEKALGSIAKSGTAPIIDVISPGERSRRQGLSYLSGPASDFICGTLQLAAGANMHVFTTGRGTPYSLDGFPVLKVSTNTNLAERWFDIIDYDAGQMLTGKSLEQSVIEFLELIVRTASGLQTTAERLGISNDIVLFNPAPVT